MLWINLVDKTGSGLWLSITALYFVVVAGLDTASTGLLLGLGGVAGIAGAPVAGRLADRLPLTRVLLAVQVVRAASGLLLLFAHGFWQLLPLVALGSLGERSASVLTKLFAARVAGQDRARYQAVQRTVVNLGYTLGGLAASAALAAGTTTVYRLLLLGDSLSFVLVALLVARCAEPPSATRTVAVGAPVTTAGTAARAGTVTSAGTAAPAATAPPPRPAGPWRDTGYLGYAALDSVMFLYGCSLTVGLPLWIVTRTTAPHGLAAAVFVINTVLVVLLQVRLARYGNSPRVAANSLRQVAVWFVLSCAATAVAVLHTRWAATVAVVAAAIAFTVVEMIQSAVSWELSVSLAPAHLQGSYVGVHGLAQSTSRCVGPLLLTSVVIAAGPAGWLGLGAVLAGAALLQRRMVLRRLDRPGAGVAEAPLSVVPITFSEQ
ncbi:MFS transporter [Streptomyces sp. NBC_01477]|uniref:MFS transporter n=1 Tax=Streptomyces sp. NBC_01477 TaxID=2976015 RepID=UPI002E343D2E|nr:MFS transporter [Streptomyces sp. NBC_01477]